MENTKECQYCAETIKAEAAKCKHCYEILDPKMRAANERRLTPRTKQWNGFVAGLLSFFIPGVGQMYKGQVSNGFIWLFFVSVGYLFFIIPGLVLHLYCVVSAASGDQYKTSSHV